MPGVMGEERKPRVIFVCTGNSCRSQMAEGFLREWAGDRLEARSAGSHPSGKVAELAIDVMSEVGIDISGHYTKSLDSVKDEQFDWVITVCDKAKDFCPVFHGADGLARVVHWSVEDPYGGGIEEYRVARDDLAKRIRKWLRDEFGIIVE